jgi:hypothetical protein
MKNQQLFEAIMAHEEEQEAHAYHSIEGQLIKTALSTAAIKVVMDEEDEKAYHQDMQEMDREPTDEELDIMFLRILEEERLTADRRVT